MFGEDADGEGGLDDEDEFILNEPIWETIGLEMRQSRSTIPTIPFDQAPRDINPHHNLLMAAEWSNCVLYYSIPLLTGRLPARYLHNWKDLVRV